MSVAAKLELNTVGLFAPSATIILSVPSKLNLSKLYLLALVLLLVTVYTVYFFRVSQSTNKQTKNKKRDEE